MPYLVLVIANRKDQQVYVSVVLLPKGPVVEPRVGDGCRHHCGTDEKRPIDRQRCDRGLSQILDLTVLVLNDHRVPWIDYRYVERTVVFTLKQKLCLIL
jgi:hypothetical protein